MRSALCIYTDDPECKINATLYNSGYKVFFEFNEDLFYALKLVSIKKKEFELTANVIFDVCIGYDPGRAKIDDMIIPVVDESTIYFAYGGYDSSTWTTSANPALFCCQSEEFNRMGELYDNMQKMQDDRYNTRNGQFLFHIKSLLLNSECTNYENSSLFIRST